jgi:hypothetical protein
LKGFDTSQKGTGHLIKETSKKSAPFSGLDVIGKVGKRLAAIPLKPVLIGAVAGGGLASVAEMVREIEQGLK